MPASVPTPLRAVPGPLVQEAFNDLGVYQLTLGKRDLGPAHARDTNALRKMCRFVWRGRLVAISGLTMAIYAIEATSITNGRLRILCQTAMDVI